MDTTRLYTWLRAGLVIALSIAFVTAAPAAQPPKVDPDFQTLKGGVISDPLWDLDVPRQDVEPVILGFVQAYESGDINRFMRLFHASVKTDSGVRAARELREDYQDLFLGTTERHIIIRNTRWSHVANTVVADADLLTSMISKRDDQRHQRNGAVRFYLRRDGTDWLIGELYFAYDD